MDISRFINSLNADWKPHYAVILTYGGVRWGESPLIDCANESQNVLAELLDLFQICRQIIPLAHVNAMRNKRLKSFSIIGQTFKAHKG